MIAKINNKIIIEREYDRINSFNNNYYILEDENNKRIHSSCVGGIDFINN